MKKKMICWFLLALLVCFSAYAQQHDNENDFIIRSLPGGRSVEIINYVGTKQEVNIPTRIQGMAVTMIGNAAFKEKELVSVTIPGSVTTIGNEAFRGNLLSSVTIPNGVSTIGFGAFAENQLASVTIGNSVNTIGDWAFACNQLTSVTIPNRVTRIGNWAFAENQLTSVTIGNNVTTIGNFAFVRNYLTNVDIPRRVTTVGNRIFGSYHDKQTAVAMLAEITELRAEWLRTGTRNERVEPFGRALAIYDTSAMYIERGMYTEALDGLGQAKRYYLRFLGR
ncbi:MAG: leucine-rich repeat domain-containing protein [Spirochaetes bacterium]|nr:leucine-rich repeat domain-containing protein [Spirochaetota bacterium]